MIWRMCGLSLREGQSRIIQHRTAKKNSYGGQDVVRTCRWHGHVECNGDAVCVKDFTKLMVDGAAVGRPRKTWHNTVSAGS